MTKVSKEAIRGRRRVARGQYVHAFMMRGAGLHVMFGNFSANKRRRYKWVTIGTIEGDGQ